jgi:hypothetical protein
MTLRDFSTLVAAQRWMFWPRDLRDHHVVGKIHSQPACQSSAPLHPPFVRRTATPQSVP